MNLNATRLGLLVAPSTPVWTGTVNSYTASTLTLSVTTVSGALATSMSNLVLVRAGVDVTRVRSVTLPGTVVLAENPHTFTAGDALALYNQRLPWPRYQRIVSGVVYKDYDIAFPSPAAREMPPAPVVWANLNGNDAGEAVWCATGQAITLDASGSYGNLAGATPLSYAWDAGTGGSITGSGAAVTATYTTTGFRYLKCTITDALGSTAVRYLPIWVGSTPTEITACSARWSAERGWQVAFETVDALSLVRHSPAILVDLDTRNVLFHGFIIPQTREITFDVSSYSFELLPALSYARYLHAYPLIVTDLRSGTADDWSEVPALTLERAMWYLLHWHSTVPEIANCIIQPAVSGRDIKGQEFRAAAVTQQVQALAQAAYWQVRGCRSGGFRVVTNALYADAATFAALSGVNWTAAAALLEALSLRYATPTISQARLGGVYRNLAGDYAAVIARAPTAPGDLGSPTEVSGLAPISEAELLGWAGRLVALENSATTYEVAPVSDVDPALYRVADVYTPEGATRIAIEEMSLSMTPAATAWDARVSGRSYGGSVNAAVVPIPPAVIVPTPVTPVTPPTPPIPPEPWGDGSHLAFVRREDTVGGADRYELTVWVTANATAADPADVTWAEAGTASLQALTGTDNEAIDLDFGQGATYGLYLITYDTTDAEYHLYYNGDPYGAGTWSEITPPSGLAFDNRTLPSSTTRAAFVPRLAPNPGGSGEVALNLYAVGGRTARYVWIVQDGATVRSSYAGGDCSGWTSYEALDWYDETTFIATYAYYASGDYHLSLIHLAKTLELTPPLIPADFAAAYGSCTAACSVFDQGEICPGWTIFSSRVTGVFTAYGVGLVADPDTADLGRVAFANECAETVDPVTGLDPYYASNAGRSHGRSAEALACVLDTTHFAFSDDGYATYTTLSRAAFSGKKLQTPCAAPPPCGAELFFSYHPQTAAPTTPQFAIARYHITEGWSDLTGDYTPVKQSGTSPRHGLAVFWGLQ